MKLYLKNIGPFREATLNVSDVTVIAGINDTGKSYLNKILFSVLKVLCVDIESDLLTNFVDSTKSFSSFFKKEIQSFEELEKVKSGEEFESFFSSLKQLVDNLDNFESFIANKYSLNDILKSYLKFLNNNQLKINNLIGDLELLKKNKFSSSLNYFLNLTYSSFEKIKLDLLLMLKENESDRYSLIWKNIFQENFAESIKNKNYLLQDSKLVLESNNSKIVDIDINNASYKIEINKNLSLFNDITYISDTFQIFEKFLVQKNFWKNNKQNYHFMRPSFSHNLTDIFEIKNFNFENDFNFKINSKNQNALNQLFFKNEIKSKFQEYFSLNNKIDKNNNSFIKEQRFSIKFFNSSKGLKIIESFNLLIDTVIFSQDNILILDEPEAFLHPEWQYLFIKWLLDITSSIKNFKLIISTHSPYIIDIINSFSTRKFKDLKFSYNFLFKDENKIDSLIETEEYPEKTNIVLNGPYMSLEDEEIEWDNKTKFNKNV